MSNEPVYRGVLELTRLVEAVKESKEPSPLFESHNKRSDKIIKKATEAIFDLKSLYSTISGESASTVKARMAIEAPRITYSASSPQSLYFLWVRVRSLILEDLNAFSTNDEESDLFIDLEVANKTIEELDSVISEPFKP